jgi:signal recognition particle subunit SEC65
LGQYSAALWTLLQRVRRRLLAQLILEQIIIAFGAAMAGVAILLLVGTQVLDWYWLVGVFAAAVAVGIWRLARRTPSRYRLAQTIDARLSLHDTLSTAYFFQTQHSRRAAPEAVAIQHEQAERIAESIDPAAAFPYVVPKALYGAFGIALVAFGMFAVRYGVIRRLDLRPSLVKIAFDTFVHSKDGIAAHKENLAQKQLEQQLRKLGINVTSPEENRNPIEPNADSALNAASSDADNSEAGSDAAKSKPNAVSNDRQATDPSEGEEQSDKPSAAGTESASDQQPAGDNGPPQNGRQNAPPKGSEQSKGDSMMDKMRDAMANLLNKLKMQPRGSESSRMSQNSEQSRSQQGKSDKNSQSAGKNKSEGTDTQGQQGEQQAQGNQTQTAQGKSGDRNADRQPSQDARSGIGKEDGDKAAKEAEQLAAMGKISEILGKRAQNVSGEVMVEAPSGKQQLRTQYSGRSALHTDSGGEISRDEVPLIYQRYVQEYFEQIRRAPATTAAPAAGRPRGAEQTAGSGQKKTPRAAE